VHYSDYNTPQSYGLLKYYFSTTTGIYNAVKVGVSILLVILAVITTIIVLAVKAKRRKVAAAVQAPAEATATVPEEPEQNKPSEQDKE